MSCALFISFQNGIQKDNYLAKLGILCRNPKVYDKDFLGENR